MDFSEYVAARGRALWRAAWLLTGDSHLAEDLVQTSLAKAWPHDERVAANGSFETYVRRAMLRTYLSWRGRRWIGEVPSADPPEDGVSDEHADVDLLRALDSLSRQQRAVVVLRYFADLTEADTAAALGCSAGTVKAHHARAIAALRTSGLLRPDEREEAR
ncbi:MAG TPA: SigE family RNA polymerase sigma factor [Nocardioides sp.]|uniref:SigE family RNA polymerase sigma factor n=1 Tax=Nocardioides sp. TaxID=35761 RepID=UPI002F42C93B